MLKSIVFFREYYRESKVKIFLYMVFSTVHYGLLLSIPYVTKLVIDSVQFKDITLFKKYALWNIVLMLIFQINIGLLDYLEKTIELSITNSLRQDIYEGIYYKDYGDIREENMGYYMERLFDDVENTKSLIISTHINIILDFIFSISIFVILFRLSRPIFFIILFTMPLFIFLNKYFTPRLEEANRRILEEKEAMKTGAEEYINGIKTLKANNTGDFARRNFKINISKYDKRMREELALNIRYDDVYLLSLMNFLSLSLNLVGGYQVLVGAISFGSFTSINLYYSRLWSPLENFMTVFKDIRIKNLSIDRLSELLKRHEEGRIDSLSNLDKLSLENIGLTFGDREIFTDLNLTIDSKDIIGIKAGNGRGKSLLAHMMVGLFKDYDGDIYYNGINYREINGVALRERVVYITSDNIIFSGTIRDNILMDRDFDLNIFDNLGFFKIFRKNNRDLDSLLTNGGEELSGGEKRLIQILRSLVNDADMYIIDEPLNYIDSNYRADIVKALEVYLRDRTVVIISHDDEAFFKGCKIYEIEDHKIGIKA